MKLTTRILLALVAAALALPLLVPQYSQAQPISAGHAPHAKASSAPMYACTICHHQVTAAEAKKLHYTCPVDHGKLLPVKPAAKKH